MHLDLPLSLASVFVQFAIDGIKGIAEGEEDVLSLFMLGRWFPVNYKLSFRTADINPGLEESPLLMALGRSLNYDVAADYLRMVTG
jgi:hypothetical protein